MWTVLFFPVAILLFVLDAAWIEQEITPEELHSSHGGIAPFTDLISHFES